MARRRELTPNPAPPAGPQPSSAGDDLARARLGELNAWSEDELRRHLGALDAGAQRAKPGDASTASAPGALALVVSVAELLDTTSDRRRAVLDLVALIVDTGVPPDELEDALEHEAGDGLAPLGYLALGELSSARAALRRSLSGAGAGASDDAADPYADAPRVHLATPRVDVYLERRAYVLGERVLARIGDHIAGCAACRGAVEARRGRSRRTTTLAQDARPRRMRHGAP